VGAVYKIFNEGRSQGANPSAGIKQVNSLAFEIIEQGGHKPRNRRWGHELPQCRPIFGIELSVGIEPVKVCAFSQHGVASSFLLNLIEAKSILSAVTAFGRGLKLS
jgi:hypothetical protein